MNNKIIMIATLLFTLNANAQIVNNCDSTCFGNPAATAGVPQSTNNSVTTTPQMTGPAPTSNGGLSEFEGQVATCSTTTQFTTAVAYGTYRNGQFLTRITAYGQDTGWIPHTSQQPGFRGAPTYSAEINSLNNKPAIHLFTSGQLGTSSYGLTFTSICKAEFQ